MTRRAWSSSASTRSTAIPWPDDRLWRELEQLQPLAAQDELSALDQPEGEVDDLRVPLCAAMRSQLLLHLLGIAGALVELPRRHDLDRVGDGDDARAERDLVAREAVRVSGPVPALVMVADDRPGRREQVERLEQRVADLRVRLDDRALLLRRAAPA